MASRLPRAGAPLLGVAATFLTLIMAGSLAASSVPADSYAPTGSPAPLPSVALSQTPAGSPSPTQATPGPVEPIPTPAPAQTPLASWRGVVLVYRAADLDYMDGAGQTSHLSASLSDSQLQTVTAVINKVPQTVSAWSDGMAQLELTVVLVPHSLEHFDRLLDDTDRSTIYDTLYPSSIQSDLDRYAPAGSYDSVFAVFPTADGLGHSIPLNAYGWTTPLRSDGSGFSAVPVPADLSQWTNDAYPEVFVHEWLHQVIDFYSAAGLNFDLHNTSKYGYTSTNECAPGATTTDCLSWNTWYRHVMSGTLPDRDGVTGLTAAVWANGTPTSPTFAVVHGNIVTLPDFNPCDALVTNDDQTTSVRVDYTGGHPCWQLAATADGHIFAVIDGGLGLSNVGRALLRPYAVSELTPDGWSEPRPLPFQTALSSVKVIGGDGVLWARSTALRTDGTAGDTTIYRSLDAGLTWTVIYGPVKDRVEILASVGPRLIAYDWGTTNGSFLLFNDFGASQAGVVNPSCSFGANSKLFVGPDQMFLVPDYGQVANGQVMSCRMDAGDMLWTPDYLDAAQLLSVPWKGQVVPLISGLTPVALAHDFDVTLAR